jgi:hypothetical protein
MIGGELESSSLETMLRGRKQDLSKPNEGILRGMWEE